MNFRYDKCVVKFAIFLTMMIVFTACEKNKSDHFAGIKLNCADVHYSTTMGMPMDNVKINVIPSEFGELLSLIVESDSSETALLVPVERDANGTGASFYLPVHPTLLSSGGEVSMMLMDEQDQYCDPVTFTIKALPDSPGAYKKLADLLVQLGNAQARIFDVDVTEMSKAKQLEDNPFAMVHFIVDDMVQGTQNPNSLKRISDNEALSFGELSEDEWKLIDGLVEKSGILQQLAQYTAHLDTMEPLAFDESTAFTSAKLNGLVSLGDLVEVPSSCLTPWHRPDAARLDKLMNMQIKNEIFGDGTELLDASALLWNAAGVLATVAGVPKAATVTNVMGHSITITKLRYEAMEGILPSEFVNLRVNVDPEKFLEDDEQLDGKWDRAMVTAQSRGWSPDKAIFEFLLNQLGGRVSKGAQKHFNLDLHEGTKALGDFASGLWDSHLTNELYGNEINRTGVFELPPCDFGPTDITDENWSNVRMIPENTGAVYLMDRYTYRAQATGEAVLEVSPRGDRFGRRALNPNGMFFSKDIPIQVLPIEVLVFPKEQSVKPGSTVTFLATVNNANDKGVVWEVHPAGSHQIEVETRQNGDSVITIHTSENEASFPVTLTAISTSSTGLRALPNAPRREGHALLRSDKEEIIITPGDCCIEPGEQQAFQATVYNESGNQQVVWTASAGSIDGNGLYTAPNEEMIVTVTATSAVDPKLHKSVTVKVGDCECRAEWEIDTFNVKQSTNTSRMERDGEDGEGRLTKLLFNNKENGENLQITFDDAGPLPGEQGTYPVRIINVANEKTAKSVVFKNGTFIALPSPHHPNGYYVIPPPSLYDLDIEPVHHELDATVTIHEFTQLGSDPHQVLISGTIQGEVQITEYNDNLSVDQNVSALHYIDSISGSFQGHYTIRYKNPMPDRFTTLRLPYVGGGSVYWDVCGLTEEEIQPALDLQDLFQQDDLSNPIDSDDGMELEDSIDWDGLMELEGIEGIEGLEDIFNMFNR